MKGSKEYKEHEKGESKAFEKKEHAEAKKGKLIDPKEPKSSPLRDMIAKAIAKKKKKGKK